MPGVVAQLPAGLARLAPARNEIGRRLHRAAHDIFRHRRAGGEQFVEVFALRGLGIVKGIADRRAHAGPIEHTQLGTGAGGTGLVGRLRQGRQIVGLRRHRDCEDRGCGKDGTDMSAHGLSQSFVRDRLHKTRMIALS
jgi:hypothetical protein